MSYPPGTWVLGVTPEGIPLRSHCEYHIFELGEPHEVVRGEQTHTLQTSLCLVCGDALPPLDVEFFTRPATDEDVARAVIEVNGTIDRMHSALSKLADPPWSHSTAVVRSQADLRAVNIPPDL